MSLYTGLWIREMKYASYGFLMKEGMRNWIAAKLWMNLQNIIDTRGSV